MRGLSEMSDYDFLTLTEVAAWLRIDRHKVTELGIPYFDWGRKSKRFVRTDVLAWLEKQRKRKGKAA